MQRPLWKLGIKEHLGFRESNTSAPRTRGSGWRGWEGGRLRPEFGPRSLEAERGRLGRPGALSPLPGHCRRPAGGCWWVRVPLNLLLDLGPTGPSWAAIAWGVSGSDGQRAAGQITFFARWAGSRTARLLGHLFTSLPLAASFSSSSSSSCFFSSSLTLLPPSLPFSLLVQVPGVSWPPKGLRDPWRWWGLFKPTYLKRHSVVMHIEATARAYHVLGKGTKTPISWWEECWKICSHVSETATPCVCHPPFYAMGGPDADMEHLPGARLTLLFLSSFQVPLPHLPLCFQLDWIQGLSCVWLLLQRLWEPLLSFLPSGSPNLELG